MVTDADREAWADVLDRFTKACDGLHEACGRLRKHLDETSREERAREATVAEIVAWLRSAGDDAGPVFPSWIADALESGSWRG